MVWAGSDDEDDVDDGGVGDGVEGWAEKNRRRRRSE